MYVYKIICKYIKRITSDKGHPSFSSQGGPEERLDIKAE
jgi:hypothetical protein